MRTICSALLSFILLLAGAAHTWARPVVPQSVWEQRFTSEEAEYEYKAGALAADQSVWLAVGSRPKGTLSGPQRLWLWHLDAGGKRLREIDLAPVAPQALNDVKDVVMRPNGSLLLVAEAGEGLFLLLGIDPQSGQRVLAKEVSRAGQRFFLNRAVALGDDQFLLVGRAGSSGLAVKINGSGASVWEHVFIQEKVTVLSDGVPMDDGRVTVVGSHLDSSGKISIWVGLLNPTGELKGSTSFSGRYAAIARGPDGKDGKYAVVHDDRGASAWDVSLRGLTAELRDAWGVKLLSDPQVTYPFRVAQVHNGDVIVVGTKDAHLWVARVGAEGKIQWSVSVQDETVAAESLWNYGLLSSGSAFVVPYSSMVVNEKQEQRQEIRVVKAMATEGSR